MATAVAPATPQRPLPGAFAVTPAPQQQQQLQQQQGSTIFAANAATLRQNNAPPPVDAPAQVSHEKKESPIERAAKSIGQTLNSEANFAELESYVQQGVSGEYELPGNPALQPFHRLKLHDLPPQLLEQANAAQVGMLMGIFAPLGHAWAALDNCLYLWDYAVPNPVIIGFEESASSITAVKLVPPKQGVFIEDIKHMIVVCTNTDMLLLGATKAQTDTGADTVALYNTHMRIPVKGINVTIIEASRTGRIFFCGTNSGEDIYEFQYQQDEGWFRGKCQRLCHTQNYSSLVSTQVISFTSIFGGSADTKSFVQMVIDDSRNLMYTLSNKSEIRVWLIHEPNTLGQGLMRPLAALLQNASHFVTRTDLLTSKDVFLVSISVIPATEGRKLSLMATTNTGCRLYLSVQRGFGYQADAQNPPSSVQISHVRFPPKDPLAVPAPTQSGQTAVTPYNPQQSSIDSGSRYLQGTEVATRFAPGYWMAFTRDPNNPSKDRVFCVATDMARIKNEPNAPNRFVEYGQWIDLPGEVNQVKELTPPFAAYNSPIGFGNEMAVQFDARSSEFAIMTTAGIQTIRRKRLVDVFAAMLKYGSSDEEGTEGDVKRFVRTYGRTEAASTALAVACGQGLDIADNRIATVSDPEILDRARRVFIEHGGSPEYNANAVVAESTTPLDNVRESPRYHGIALYVSRLVRSIWSSKIIVANPKPGVNGSKYISKVNPHELTKLQQQLSTLKEFLDRNSSFIEGLAGPAALSRVKSRQEEIALQGENRAMRDMLQLVESVTEGISFVKVLFDERVEDILALLQDESRSKALELTFETLFVGRSGRELGRELVKAIVNRNIANGSNIDTVAEALRRRCGSFCSPDDVVIFKAQEQVKRAKDAGSQTETGRQLLNESQRLFQKCALNLSYEYLKKAIEDYVDMAFYAGAIQLCLVVAAEKDKSKRALAWLRDGTPEPDARQEAFELRKQSYDLIFRIMEALDQATSNASEMEDGRPSLATRRRTEAYDVVNGSDDIVFLTCLYDYYISTLQQPDRLINITNPYVVEYLRKRSQDHRLHNDILWRYFAHYKDFLQAAGVQLDLARSHFEGLTLDERLEYLSRARANASTRQTIISDSRQNKQRLLREISDLVEIAEVQHELLERLRAETRIQDPQHKAALIGELSGEILPVETLFNKYADPAKYHDICLLLYKVADHRNPGDIKASWEQLIKDISAEAIALYGHALKPWEAVGEEVRRVGRRLGTNPSTFPINTLVPLLEIYALEPRRDPPPDTWAIDVFRDLEIPCETLLPVLESMYYSNMAPFTGNKKKKVAEKMIYVIQKWFEESEKSGERVLFGSEENASLVKDCIEILGRDGTLSAEARDAGSRVLYALS